MKTRQTTSDGIALYSESHYKDPHPVRTAIMRWIMFENIIGRFIWKPTLEDDCLVYRPFWKL